MALKGMCCLCWESVPGIPGKRMGYWMFICQQHPSSECCISNGEDVWFGQAWNCFDSSMTPVDGPVFIPPPAIHRVKIVYTDSTRRIVAICPQCLRKATVYEDTGWEKRYRCPKHPTQIVVFFKMRWEGEHTDGKAWIGKNLPEKGREKRVRYVLNGAESGRNTHRPG